MKTSSLLIAAMLGMGMSHVLANDGGSSVYVYNATDQVLTSSASVTRIELSDGQLVLRSASGEALSTTPLAEVDYFAFTADGPHNNTTALSGIAAGDVRVVAEGNLLTVTASEAIQAVSVYSLDGRQLASAANCGTTCRLAADATGALLVRVATAQGVTTVKIIK